MGIEDETPAAQRLIALRLAIKASDATAEWPSEIVETAEAFRLYIFNGTIPE